MTAKTDTNKITTEWKSTSFVSNTTNNTLNTIPVETPSGVNYTNIQLPVMDEFVKSITNITHNRSTIETFENNTNDEDIDELDDMVDPLLGKQHAEYVDDKYIGLNASETRLSSKKNKASLSNTTAVNVTAMADTPNAIPIKATTDEIKRRELERKWDSYMKNRSFKNAKELAITFLDNIPHLFYLPDMIAKKIVNHGTENKKRNTVDYLNNRNIIKNHMKSFLTLFICLYITFNWWNLFFYTNHYIDLYELLNSPVFSPIAWIIKPVLSPLTTLNYYLLGKRLEPDVIQSYIDPILKNKAFFLSMLFIGTLVLYEPFITMYTSQTKHIIQGNAKEGSTTLLLFIITFCVINFLYTVVFNNQNIEVLVMMATNFLITILIYIIVFIMIIVFCKSTVLFLAIYLAYYSLLHFILDKTVFVPSHIMRMISDTTLVGTTESENEKENGGFIQIMKTIFVKYSFIILLFGVFASHVIKAIVDTSKITVSDVRVTCYAIYVSLLLALVFSCYYTYITIKNRLSGLQISADILDQLNTDNNVSDSSSAYEEQDITNTSYNRNTRHTTIVDEYGLPILELIKIIVEYIVILPFTVLMYLSKPIVGENSVVTSFFRNIIGTIHNMFTIRI